MRRMSGGDLRADVAGWRMLAAAAVESYPGPARARLRTRAKLFWSLARRRAEIQAWLADPTRGDIREAVRRTPSLLGFFVCPYLHAAWPVERRFEAILEHHRIVQRQLPALSLPPRGGRTLLELDHLAAGLRLTLDRSNWFFREGELVLNLVKNDRRLMSLAFALGTGPSGLVAYVGALQGARGPDVLAIYRRLTHLLHGLRPRDLMVRLFQSLAAAVGVSEIRCVADESRHQRHPYFADRLRARLHLDYDEVWQEHGATLARYGFFVLGVTVAPRPLDTVPTRKRAMYRRRNALLEELDELVRMAISSSNEAGEASASCSAQADARGVAAAWRGPASPP